MTFTDVSLASYIYYIESYHFFYLSKEKMYYQFINIK